MTDQNDNGNDGAGGNGKDRKVINLAAAAAESNRKSKEPVRHVTGTVTYIADLSALSAVAFRVKHGAEETLFWMSTQRQKEDADYRKPLLYETVKVWFNEKARTLDVFGEKALGVAEIQNISNDAEREAFQWFRDNPNGLGPR